MILHDEQGRPKFAIDIRFLIVVLIVGLVFLLVVLFKPQHSPIGSCAQLNLKGFTKVTPSNGLFNKALDKNNDGVEC